MKDEKKTKGQLINELVELRQRVAELKASGTKDKRAEEALRESEQEYRTMIEQSNDMIWTLDTEGNLTFFNKRSEEFTGHRLEDWRGKSFAPLIVKEDLPLVMDVFHRTLNGEPQHYEARVKKDDGDILILSVNTAPILKDGQVVGTVSFGRDVTERVQAEGALQESERRYRLLAENVTDVIWTMDMNLRYTYVSPSIMRMRGYSVEETMAQTVEEALTPASLEVATKVFAEEMAIERMEQKVLSRSATLELEQYCKDGSTIWTELKVTGLRDPDGRLVGILGVTRDITERKRMEDERTRLLAQIQGQAQRVQQIVDTVPEGVLLLDADGQVVLANPLGRKDLVALANASVGDTLTHLGGRPLAELLTSPYHGFWHEVALEGPPPRVFEIIAKPIETGPSSDGWVLVIRDMTREREFQRHSQQQARLATVGQLAAGIAHDFNNIMATIVLYAQMLSQTEGLSPRSSERLATINQQARHATNLIQQILDFSRRAVLERQSLNLLPLLKEQIKLLERTLPENIQIALAYGPDEYTVNADPTRVQQAMMNLAVNARDAMQAGGDLRFGLERIQVQPGELPPLPEMKAGEWVQVTVADTGSGIPPDVLPHVFDPFFTTKAPGEGSGLGLAQVHGIVKQHEGEIGVQSQEGHGTTFTIYLPALPVHPVEAPTLEPPVLTKGQGEVILVVEDDASTRQALVEGLELLNYLPLAAADGREALEILERQSSAVSNPEVALVLSDVVMPGMGGVALFHALRQRGLTIKVVLMTGHPLEEEMERLQTQGLSDWLPKPSNLEQLAQVLARALEEG